MVLKKRSDSGCETSQISKTTTRKRASSVGVSESEIFTSRFRRIASGYISLGNIKKNQTGSIELDIHDEKSCLEPKMTFQFGCNYSILRKFRSFLTLSDNSQPLWTRFWAVMKNDKLCLWQYPGDEASKDPIKTIELIELDESSIKNSDESIGLRPFTFHIQTKNHRLRYSLSSDDREDMQSWKTALFEQIQDLRSWTGCLRDPEE